MLKTLVTGLGMMLVGCGSSFTAESVVEGLRILGLRADPADLRPGESTALNALVVDPTRRSFDLSVLWFLCDPDPFNLNRTACSDSAVLSESPLFSTTPSQEVALPPGMHLIGINSPPSFSVAANLFSPLSPNDSRRITGTVAEILVFAVAETLPLAPTPNQLQALLQRVQSKAVPSVMALFRVRVSEDPQRNQNPQLRRLITDGTPLPNRAILRVNIAQAIGLDIEVSDASFEEYDQLTPSGIERRQKRLIAAYYTTLGHLSNDRVALRSRAATASLFLSADTSIVQSRGGVLWVVVRDTRGGVSWIEIPAFVCDPSRATPNVTVLQTQAIPGGIAITLQGQQLQEILEVWVDDIPLRNPQYVPRTQRFSGNAPTLPSGQHVVKIRSTNCSDPPPLTFFL